ncbi:MAG: hypothetical protein R3312_06020 [Gammaproteobacteria bacterium]|nr:hypothetical protein [Gammaproteobacteria bacterium]
MLSKRSALHLSLELPDRDCLLHIQLLLHLFVLEMLIMVDWELPGFEYLLITLLIVHFLEYLKLRGQRFQSLSYRDADGWVLTDHNGVDSALVLNSMHWNAFRWIMLNFKNQVDQKSLVTIVFCPGNLSVENYRQIKKVYLLSRNNSI